MVPDAAAGVPDIRDAFFHLSQEGDSGPLARTAGSPTPASSNLHAADASAPRHFRSGVDHPAEQQGGTLRLADDPLLRRTGHGFLGRDALARGGVTLFLRRIHIALSLAAFLEPQRGLTRGGSRAG